MKEEARSNSSQTDLSSIREGSLSFIDFIYENPLVMNRSS